MARITKTVTATGSVVLGEAGRESGSAWIVGIAGVAGAAISGSLQFKGYFGPAEEAVDIPAGNTLTVSAAAQPSDTNTVTIGTQVYTFKTALTPIAFEVLIGVDSSGSLDNLVSAINLTGTPGTDYAAATTANTTVTAAKASASTMSVRALPSLSRDAGNAVATTKTITNWTWAKATLDVGLNPDLTALAYYNTVDQTVVAGSTPATITVPAHFYVRSDRQRVVLFYTKTTGNVIVTAGTNFS